MPNMNEMPLQQVKPKTFKKFLMSIHMVPIIMGLITIIAPFVVGIVMFNIANSDSGSRPAAPFTALFGFAMAFVGSSLISAFATSLTYLIFRLSKNIGLRVFQIIATVITGLMMLPILALILQNAFA